MTREWTRVAISGPAPAGRYGHAVAMVGTRFYVFGGQMDGEFLNDLWAFDLNTRKLLLISSDRASAHIVKEVRNKACWELIKPSSNEGPARRTGHTCITYGDRIIMFALSTILSKHQSEFVIGSAAQTRNTITMIPGLSIPTRDNGQS